MGFSHRLVISYFVVSFARSALIPDGLAPPHPLSDSFPAAIPSFLDCTDEKHKGWHHFKTLFDSAAETTGGFPGMETELAFEANRLHRQWYSKLPTHNEDYPAGSADFYHKCHWGEESSYCLYGHVAALTYLARWTVNPEHRHVLATHALRLLNWNHCLDFIESSSWGFSVLDLWDLTGSHQYPQVTMMHQYMQWGAGVSSDKLPASAPSATATQVVTVDPKPTFWITEVGIHRALSNEAVSMFERVLPSHNIVYLNFQKPYEGRAEAFAHPFPRECSPNCRYQQDSVPYTFPVFEEMNETKNNLQHFYRTGWPSKPEVRSSSAILCSNPIYWCALYAGLNRTVIGYFGLPLLYLVPHDDWGRWTLEFAEMALSPKNIFFANNPLLAEQLVWQSGVRIRVVQPVVLYIKEVYFPSRVTDVLVPEPREGCVLNCLLRAFTPPSYPFRFFAKADTDRTFATFSSFRSIVIFPHDVALMSFYEFYALGIPLFLPSHLSKYIFPYSASVPLLDFVPQWLRNCSAATPEPPEAVRHACRESRPDSSPLSLTSSSSLRYWSRFMDFFRFPGVQFFPSLAGLMDMLPKAKLHEISARMRASHSARLVEAVIIWRDTAVAALADAVAESNAAKFDVASLSAIE
eukprot:TRINITY_DN45572_c0_g1_i1.p1 TRINITY_DN45572_c0_g1~~TRINITY_DN45572_c0_g1_i1.p1  ORF type:complete len:635 (+),score=57.59 TRINITY_DN45572_c0_g1_i1:209-2113(+)